MFLVGNRGRWDGNRPNQSRPRAELLYLNGKDNLDSDMTVELRFGMQQDDGKASK